MTAGVVREVKVPVWLLKNIVELEWEQWSALTPNLDLDEEDLPKFPESDTVIEAIIILEEAGIKFDSKKGKWR